MTTGAEKVQYLIEVDVKGQQSLTQLHTQLALLHGMTGAKAAPMAGLNQGLQQTQQQTQKTGQAMQQLHSKFAKFQNTASSQGGVGGSRKTGPSNPHVLGLQQQLAKYQAGAGAAANPVAGLNQGLQQTQQQVAQTGQAMKQQSGFMGTLNSLFEKGTGPVRQYSGLLSKLNPTVLASSLGVGGLVAGLTSLNNQLDSHIILNSTVTAATNRYTTAQQTWTGAMEDAYEKSEALQIPVTDIQQSYATMLPVVRDMAVAEGILTDAVDAHRKSGIPLKQVLADLMHIYDQGGFVMTDAGGKWMQGAEGVDALHASMVQGNSSAVEYKTSIDDIMDTRWDKIKRDASMLGGIAVTAGKFIGLGILGDKKGQQQVADATFENVFGGRGGGAVTPTARPQQDRGGITAETLQNNQPDVSAASAYNNPNSFMNIQNPPEYAKGGIITRPTLAMVGEAGPEAIVPLSGQMQKKFNRSQAGKKVRDIYQLNNVPASIPRFQDGGIVTKPTVGMVGEAGPEAIVPLGNQIDNMFNKESINKQIEDSFKFVPRSIWQHISGRWDTDIHWPFWDRIKAMMRPDLLQAFTKETFGGLPQTIWDLIGGVWESIVHNPFIEKIREMFSKDNIIEIAQLAFVDIPNQIIDWITGQWESLIKSPFMEKMRELFDWDAIKAILTIAFFEVPAAIWGFIGDTWDTVIHSPFMTKLKALFNWESNKELISTAFSEVPQTIWAFISRAWESVVHNPFIEKLRALFSWDTIKAIITIAFFEIPASIWGFIGDTWDAIIHSPFMEKIRALFSWETIKTILTIAFINVPSAIWGTIVGLWEAALCAPWWAKIGALFNWSNIKTILETAFINVPASIWDFITDTWENVLASPWWEMLTTSIFNCGRIVEILKTVFIGVPGAIWSFILSLWNNALVTPWWNIIGNTIFNWPILNKFISDTFSPVADTIWSWLSKAVNIVFPKFTAAWSVMKVIIHDPFVVGMENVKETVRQGVEYVKEVVRDLERWIKDVMKKIWGLITRARKAIGSIASKIPGLAEGGIVTKPTLAMIGEAGPEAVVPLTGSNTPNLGGGGGPQEINIYLDGKRLERFVVDGLDKRVRLRGSR